MLQVERRYLAISIGMPKQGTGSIETNIGRDPNDRKRMSPFGFHSSRCCSKLMLSLAEPACTYLVDLKLKLN